MLRVIFGAVLVVSLCIPATGETIRGASDSVVSFERVDGAAIIDQVFRERQRAPKAGDAVRPRAIAIDWALPAILIPAAGSLQGGGGTFFRSDVTLVSWGPEDREIIVFWIPRGVDGTNGEGVRLVLSPATPWTVRDFVTELGISGLGALFIYGVEPGEVADDDTALLDGFSRIWTPQPGSNGTVSQPFNAQDPSLLTGELLAVSLGLRQDASFRTNAGIVNMSPQPKTFTVRVFGTAGSTAFQMSLPPLSMQQVAIPAGNWGDVALQFEKHDQSAEGGWAAYGTSVDNVTGDGWVSPAKLPF